MIHEWRHLRQLRRAGRGHDPAGAKATTAGELAVQCPACPHPGKNLPQDWQNEPLSVRYVKKTNSAAITTDGLMLFVM